jgi:DNA-binding HxlR family transcriptional regulator
VLYHLSKGTLRYGELQRAVGTVTHKVLIQQLKELEADRIVKRVNHGEVPRSAGKSAFVAGSRRTG